MILFAIFVWALSTNHPGVAVLLAIRWLRSLEVEAEFEQLVAAKEPEPQ